MDIKTAVFLVLVVLIASWAYLESDKVNHDADLRASVQAELLERGFQESGAR